MQRVVRVRRKAVDQDRRLLLVDLDESRQHVNDLDGNGVRVRGSGSLRVMVVVELDVVEVKGTSSEASDGSSCRSGMPAAWLA